MGRITTKKASEILGCTTVWIRTLIKEKKLPAQKFGRDYVIQEKDLEPFKRSKGL